MSTSGTRDAFPGSAPGVVPREAVAPQVFLFHLENWEWELLQGHWGGLGHGLDKKLF